MSEESPTKSIVQPEGSSQSQYPSVLNNSTLGTKVGIHHSRTSFFSNSAVKKIWGSYLTQCCLGPAMLLCTHEQCSQNLVTIPAWNFLGHIRPTWNTPLSQWTKDYACPAPLQRTQNQDPAKTALKVTTLMAWTLPEDRLGVEPPVF